MKLLKRIISYSPYLLVLFVVLPIFAGAANGTDDGSMFSIKNILWTFVNNVFGFLIGAAGVVLDYAVNDYVIGFGETWGVNASGVGGAIDMSWKIVRDVFNITFIFGLVWLGFKMILRSDDSNTRRTLITLIIAALLVNFSLFITKFIVDFTNILATEIASSFSENGNPANKSEVSQAFMQLFGVTSIFDYKATGGEVETLPDDVSYMYIFGTAIVFLIGAFTFAAGGIMLIIRFAALCIYMVFSPLMFLGMVFPGLRSVSSKYWSGFLGRAFYAPAYLMLIYLAAFVMGSYNSTAASFAHVLKGRGEQDVAATLTPFLLTCVFLIASVVVAGKMSADGSTAAIKLGRNITGRAQRGVRNATIGTGRFAARQTGGRLARGHAAAARSSRRELDRGLGKLAQGGAIARATARGVDNTYGSYLRASERASVAGSETLEQKDKRIKDHQQKFNTTTDESNRNIETKTAYNTLHNKNSTKEQREKAEKDLAKNIAKMSTEEYASLPQKMQESETLSKHLSEALVKSMAESGMYTNAGMKKIKDSRTAGVYKDTTAAFEDFSGTAQELGEHLEDLNRTVSRWSGENLETMAGSRLENSKSRLTDQRIAMQLSQRQLDTMRDSGKISTDDYKDIVAARKSGFAAVANTGSAVTFGAKMDASEKAKSRTQQREKLFTQSAQDAGKMPAEVFENKDMAKYITPAALQQRVRSGLTGDEKDRIQKNITNYLKQSDTPQQKKDMWKKWSSGNNTEGNQFDFKVTGGTGGGSASTPSGNPHNQFGSAAEAERWAQWNKNNK